MTTLAEEQFQHQLTKQELLAAKLEIISLQSQIESLKRKQYADFEPSAFAESYDKNRFHA